VRPESARSGGCKCWSWQCCCARALTAPLWSGHRFQAAVSQIRGEDCGVSPNRYRPLGGGREGAIERAAADRVGGGARGEQPAWVLVGLPSLTQAHKHRFGQRNEPLFITFTDNTKQSVVAVDGTDLKGCGLADPQTAGIHDGKASSVDRVRYAA